MPELPEVETVARGLSQRLTGAKVAWVRIARRDIIHGCPARLENVLPGTRLIEIARRGKQIQVRTSSEGLSLVIHLGMTGRLVVVPSRSTLEPHTHLRIGFHKSRQELRFIDPRRFGGLWVLRESAQSRQKWIGRRVPPVAADPLQISSQRFCELLAGRRRQIKPLLLDQEPISGMGNIYCDESLHRAGVHPLQRAADLTPDQLRRLYTAIRRVLTEAIAAGGSSVDDYRNADNEHGWFQLKHRVYGRTGEACRRCGRAIERLVISGRSTHFCPSCQPLR